jgi:hypothetical protein
LGRSIQELDRSSLRPSLTLTDQHPYTLTFRQTTQSAAIERRGMDEHILPTTILRYETESLSALYHLAAHSTSIRIRNNNQMSRSLQGRSQEGAHGNRIGRAIRKNAAVARSTAPDHGDRCDGTSKRLWSTTIVQPFRPPGAAEERRCVFVGEIATAEKINAQRHGATISALALRRRS